jgi:16S rRNA (cytidine1402-2'-O)-methyltransferase
VFFESPQRLKETLQDALDILGPRLAVVARELTKKFEETRRATLDRLVAHYEKISPKGEIVLLISGASAEQAVSEQQDPREILTRHLAEHSLKDAVQLAYQETGYPRSQLYHMALALQEKHST